MRNLAFRFNLNRWKSIRYPRAAIFFILTLFIRWFVVDFDEMHAFVLVREYTIVCTRNFELKIKTFSFTRTKTEWNKDTLQRGNVQHFVTQLFDQINSQRRLCYIVY